MTTAVQKVDECLKKFEEKARLRAIIEVNPLARAIAAELDASDDKSGALHGVPVLIKDNVNTIEMHTTAGSVALAANAPGIDAPAVANLRAAGAIIIGKANMTEFANYMCDFRLDESMPNGYSSRGGQTLHPTHDDADPLGSSTGSAVAVAAGLVPMAVGSETYGSIISPAQHCGIVGIKPTDGLISKEGVIPISFTLDTLGPMAKTVENAALLLGALAGRQYEMTHNPAEIRVGICQMDGENAEFEAALRANFVAIDLPDPNFPEFTPGDDLFLFPIMEYEFQHAINGYLAAIDNPNVPRNLKEIIEFNRNNPEIALKYGQGNLIAASKISKNWENEREYVAALAKREATIDGLNDYFDAHNIDVLAILSGDCGLAAATGFPSLTLPIGKTAEGLPIGCLLMARPYAEDVLLSAAKAIEKLETRN
ncbi:MAG: hypothetical protein LBE35_06430 [Clostridiales bacterium]|jgi:amidase|nr:hypothetical protein [Clostridiales bacterium]